MEKNRKIISDTLKGPDGKYSRKSLTILACLIMSFLVGSFIVLSDYFLTKEINQYAILVFYGFLGVGGGTLGLTVIDKFKNGNRQSES